MPLISTVTNKHKKMIQHWLLTKDNGKCPFQTEYDDYVTIGIIKTTSDTKQHHCSHKCYLWFKRSNEEQVCPCTCYSYSYVVKRARILAK